MWIIEILLRTDMHMRSLTILSSPLSIVIQSDIFVRLMYVTRTFIYTHNANFKFLYSQFALKYNLFKHFCCFMQQTLSGRVTTYVYQIKFGNKLYFISQNAIPHKKKTNNMFISICIWQAYLHDLTDINTHCRHQLGFDKKSHQIILPFMSSFYQTCRMLFLFCTSHVVSEKENR